MPDLKVKLTDDVPGIGTAGEVVVLHLQDTNPATSRPQTARLLREAANEIEELRATIADLDQYRRHTERLLALFEGGPPRHGGMDEAGGPNLVWKLRSIAENFDQALVGVSPSKEE